MPKAVPRIRKGQGLPRVLGAPGTGKCQKRHARTEIEGGEAIILQKKKH